MALKEIRDKNQSAGECKLAIDGEFNIYAAMEIKESLNEYLQKHESFIIDLSCVTEIDSSGIQILLSFNKAVENSNKTFSISSPSSVVKTILDLFHAHGHLNLFEEAV